MTHHHNNRFNDGRRRGEQVLDKLLAQMSAAQVGARNKTLNGCAFAIGRLAAGGVLDGPSALPLLAASAAGTGLRDPEVSATIKSAYEAGMKHPRDLSKNTASSGRRYSQSRPSARPPESTAGTVTSNKEARRRANIARLERRLRPCINTNAEKYLASRGLPLHDIGADDLLFAKDLGYYDDERLVEYLDALVARVRSFETGEIIAHQRTYLAANGAGKATVPAAKKATAPFAGGGIFLGEVRNADHVGYAEGLEDAGTGRLASGLPVAAVMGMANFVHVVPGPNTRLVTIFADAGPDALASANALAVRLRQQGISVRIVSPPEPYKDLNDVLTAVGIDAVKAAIDASPWMPAWSPTTSRNKAAGRDDWLYDGVSVAAVPARHIEWFWEPWIAFGKVSIIFGPPGQGKSQLTAYLAARVTTGSAFVNGKSCASGSVIMIACEDDVADTVRPRLAAAGADLSKVDVLNATRVVNEKGKLSEPGHFNLATGMQALEQMVDDIGDVKLIVIDPVTAYLSGTDSHKNADVRAVLLPLQEMAARKAVAVVLVTHLNKATGMDAMSRVTGSGAFVAAARAAFLVSKLPDQPEKRAFLPAKNNIGDDATGLTFTIESCAVENGIKTSRVVFDATPTSMTADEVLEGGAPNGARGQSAKDDAIEWLRDLLANGPVLAEEVLKRAEVEGLATKTIRRAKREIGVISEREGFGKEGVYSWRLPDGIKD